MVTGLDKRDVVPLLKVAVRVSRRGVAHMHWCALPKAALKTVTCRRCPPVVSPAVILPLPQGASAAAHKDADRTTAR